MLPWPLRQRIPHDEKHDQRYREASRDDGGDEPDAGTPVHATTVTITQGIGSDARHDAAALAQTYLDLHSQPETEWQPELVL